jgi:hypothetical protein
MMSTPFRSSVSHLLFRCIGQVADLAIGQMANSIWVSRDNHEIIGTRAETCPGLVFRAVPDQVHGSSKLPWHTLERLVFPDMLVFTLAFQEIDKWASLRANRWLPSSPRTLVVVLHVMAGLAKYVGWACETSEATCPDCHAIVEYEGVQALGIGFK